MLAQNGAMLPPLAFSWRAIEPYAVLMRYDFGPVLPESQRISMCETVAKLREHVIARTLAVEGGKTP